MDKRKILSATAVKLCAECDAIINACYNYLCNGHTVTFQDKYVADWIPKCPQAKN